MNPIYLLSCKAMLSLIICKHSIIQYMQSFIVERGEGAVAFIASCSSSRLLKVLGIQYIYINVVNAIISPVYVIFNLSTPSVLYTNNVFKIIARHLVR